MRGKPEYSVSGGEMLSVSRFYKKTGYALIFEKSDELTQIKASNYNFAHGDKVYKDESCAVPQWVMRKNVFRMIGDLPLDETQKTYLP
jgi:hypothetical protein